MRPCYYSDLHIEANLISIFISQCFSGINCNIGLSVKKLTKKNQDLQKNPHQQFQQNRNKVVHFIMN